MNFFGHAVAACWRNDATGFVLGAMLPDFATMCGGKIAGVDNQPMADGLDWHHVCDAAFHRMPMFRDRVMAASGRMQSRSIRRGPARGAAHVGFELFLDGCLLGNEPAVDAYRAALDRADPGDLGERIRWRDGRAADRFEILRRRLIRVGSPTGYADKDVVIGRVIQVLSRRPRLAPDDSELEALAHELRILGREVDALAASLMDQLAHRVMTQHR